MKTENKMVLVLVHGHLMTIRVFGEKQKFWKKLKWIHIFGLSLWLHNFSHYSSYCQLLQILSSHSSEEQFKPAAEKLKSCKIKSQSCRLVIVVVFVPSTNCCGGELVGVCGGGINVQWLILCSLRVLVTDLGC